MRRDERTSCTIGNISLVWDEWCESCLKLAFHDADTDTDSPNTATILPREEIACVGRKIVAVFGESLSASWNASIIQLGCLFGDPSESISMHFPELKF